jgi:hypothetical protein
VHSDRWESLRLDPEYSVFDLLPDDVKGTRVIRASQVHSKSWNILMKALSKRPHSSSDFNRNEVTVEFLKSVKLHEVADLRGVGAKILEEWISDFGNVMNLDSEVSFSYQVQTLFELLPESYREQQFVSRYQLSTISWNLLSRYFKRHDTDYDEGARDMIFVSSLKTVNMQDLGDLVNVGFAKIEKLKNELSNLNSSNLQTPSPIFRQLFPKPVLLSARDRLPELPMPIELQMALIAIKSSDSESDLLSDFDLLKISDLKTTYRTAFIFVSRFAGATLEEIANNLGLTRERVRQILEKEFEKLQEYGYFIDETLMNLLRAKLLTNAESTSLESKNLVIEVERQIRLALRSTPGLTYIDLSQLTGKSRDWLMENVSIAAKKFICTKSEDSPQVPKRLAEAELISRLQEAARIESPLTQSAYSNLVKSGLIPGPGPQTIAIRFGTWRRACEMAGIAFHESFRSNYESKWEGEEVLKAIVRFLQNQNFGRSYEDYDRWRIQVDGVAPSGAKLRTILGTWSDVRCAAFKYMRTHGIVSNLEVYD